MASKAAAEPQLVRALTSFVGVDGLVITSGSIFTSDHPDVRAHPALFGPVVASRVAEPVIEQATAAPGEKRGA